MKTPRTDKEDCNILEQAGFVPADFARKLEREATQLKEAIVAADNASGAHEGVGLLYWMEMQGLEKTRHYKLLETILANVSDHRPLPDSAVTTRKESNE
jgi:citrate synthase